MHFQNSFNRFLGLVGLGALLSVSAAACGGDDGDSDDDGNGARAGSSSNAGKGGSNPKGGSPGTGGSSNVTGGMGGEDATSGSGGGDAGGGGEGGSGMTLPTRLRVVHASPNAPSVDVYPAGNATAVASDVSYGSATEFVEVEPGALAVDLRAAGDETTAEPAYTSEEITLEAGADYTIIAAGDFENADDAETGFRLLALQHDFEAAGDGSVATRIVHATAGLDTVDLDLLATDDVDLAGLDRFADESNVELPAGADLDVAFSTADDGVVSQLTVPELAEGDELFVIATGNPGFPFRAPLNGFALLVVDQNGQTSWVMEDPWIHLVHASDVGAADIYVSTATAATARLVSDLTAGTMAGFQLKASSAGVTLKAVASGATSGTATAIASGPTSTINNGRHYLGYISGDEIHVVREQFALDEPTQAMMRGVHAADAVTQSVDFGTVTAVALTSTLVENVGPDEASAEAGVALAPGNVTLGVAVTGNTAPLLASRAFAGAAAPRAGERSFVLFTDGATELWLVDTSVAGWSLR